VLPLATPFVIGIHADSIAPSSQMEANAYFHPRSSVPTIPSLASKQKSSLLMQQNGDITNSSDTKKSQLKSQSQGAVSSIPGEHQTDFLSRMLYLYVTPILRISSKRRLESSDVLSTESNIKMDQKVPALEKIYEKCRLKAKKIHGGATLGK